MRLISNSGGDVQTDHDMGFHCGSAAGRTGESNYYWWLEPVRGLLNVEAYSLYSTFDNLQELQNRVCRFTFDLHMLEEH